MSIWKSSGESGKHKKPLPTNESSENVGKNRI